MNAIDLELQAERLIGEPMSRLLLAIVPEELREAYVGDLRERLEREALPRRSALQARAWLRREIVRSIPAMLRHRTTAGGPRATMRWIAGFLVAGIGALQAWDANAHRSSELVIALVSFAIVVPAGAMILSARKAAMFLSLIVSLILLTAARIVAPESLSGLHLVVIPASSMFFALVNPAFATRWFGRQAAG